ncbi:MAG: hypothetical protein K6G64_09365 [Eubacterium sp.]|nr:hypothetical protein [Eubacterium sp.]
MNIRFLAQAEYFNCIHLKEDIILEKEYTEGIFDDLPKVRYFLYYLEENVRKEVMPHDDKMDIFQITNCQFDSDFIYFTSYEELPLEGYIFNIIRYNIVDHTSIKIITLKDDATLYPKMKEIKIFVLDDSNLIVQRSLLQKKGSQGHEGFYEHNLLLFNFLKNKQINIYDENLVKNGIEYILPCGENNCIMKTGFSLFKDDLRNKINKEEASVESLFAINIQQFISDLQLDRQNLVMSAIDQSYYDTTIVHAKIIENYLIYSKYNFESNEENVIFYNIISKELYTCINNTSLNDSLLKNATVIDETPYMLTKNSSGTQFFNLVSNEIVATYSEDFHIEYINNTTIISTSSEKNLFGKEKKFVNINKFPSKKVVLQENGEYLGAVSSNRETTFIFLK